VPYQRKFQLLRASLSPVYNRGRLLSAGDGWDCHGRFACTAHYRKVPGARHTTTNIGSVRGPVLCWQRKGNRIDLNEAAVLGLGGDEREIKMRSVTRSATRANRRRILTQIRCETVKSLAGAFGWENPRPTNACVGVL